MTMEPPSMSHSRLSNVCSGQALSDDPGGRQTATDKSLATQ